MTNPEAAPPRQSALQEPDERDRRYRIEGDPHEVLKLMLGGPIQPS